MSKRKLIKDNGPFVDGWIILFHRIFLAFPIALLMNIIGLLEILIHYFFIFNSNFSHKKGH